MTKFRLDTVLIESRDKVSQKILDLNFINDELSPWVRISAPKAWLKRPLTDWPIGRALFTGKVSLLGIMPLDWHEFKFNYVGRYGFSEQSTSFINKQWKHNRLISGNQDKTIVTDVIEYDCRLKWLGVLILPIYKLLFKHRHKRLKKLIQHSN